MCADRCTLYACIRTRNDSVYDISISVEGRKSLCLSAAPKLISFADEHYSSRFPVSFQLQFRADATWITEAHYFQVCQWNLVSSLLQISRSLKLL